MFTWRRRSCTLPGTFMLHHVRALALACERSVEVQRDMTRAFGRMLGLLCDTLQGHAATDSVCAYAR
jgi:hypothetical protein